jgi:hypothetical protein
MPYLADVVITVDRSRRCSNGALAAVHVAVEHLDEEAAPGLDRIACGRELRGVAVAEDALPETQVAG